MSFPTQKIQYLKETYILRCITIIFFVALVVCLEMHIKHLTGLFMLHQMVELPQTTLIVPTHMIIYKGKSSQFSVYENTVVNVTIHI